MPHTEHTPQNVPTIRRVHLVTPALLQGATWPLGRLALDFFTHLEITGREHLRDALRVSRARGRGVIFALNHTSELDFMFPLVALPPLTPLFPMFYVTHGRSRYLQKRDLGWRRYVYGLPAFLTAWGAHRYIAGQKNYARAMPHHVKLLRLGKSVCIFPEGKIKKKVGEKRAHGGVGYLAEASGTVVVPIAVSGASRMSASDFLLRRRRLRITYGAPLHPHDIIDASLPVPERYQKAAERIMTIIDTMRAAHHRDEELDAR